MRQLVREDRPRRARRERLRLHRHADLPVEEPGAPVRNGDQRKIRAPRVEDHELRHGEPPSEQRRLHGIGGLEILAGQPDELLADARVGEDREVIERDRALAARHRELVARPGQAAEHCGIAAPEPHGLAPRQDGVVEAVQVEVDVPEHAVDLGRRPRGALLGPQQIEVRGLVVLRTEVTERELGQDEAVLLVERVRFGKQLRGAVDGALREVRRAHPLELAGGAGSRRGSSRGLRSALLDRRDLPVPGRTGRRHGAGLGTRREDRRQGRAEDQGTRKAVVAWRAGPPTPSWRKTRSP